MVRDFALHADPIIFWFFATIIAAGGLIALVHAARLLTRAGVVANTPTSAIGTAAQGFVELEGRGALLPGPPIVAPLTGTPCLWYHVKAWEAVGSGNERRWDLITDDCSDSLFLLRDRTGECVIDPEGAAIAPNTKLAWSSHSAYTGLPPAAAGWASGGRYRFSEERLEEGTRLYVMGWYATHGGSQEVPDTPAEVRALLNEWKRDYPTLLHRFDADRNGQLDLHEWEAARKAAHEEVRRHQRERFGGHTVNVVSRPADGRAFIISSIGQEQLLRRWRRQASAEFGLFVLAAALVAYAVIVRLGA